MARLLRLLRRLRKCEYTGQSICPQCGVARGDGFCGLNQ